ncbi:MAG TPA: hypothetical protein VKM94_15220 [Blastocatellia bacterium]|nr:hypothetical protein [Blastocatellia bacterium]
MEKSYYIVTFKSEYFAEFSANQDSGQEPLDREEQRRLPSPQDSGLGTQHSELPRVILGITQGGFGQDVINDEQQVKERFLEYLFSFEDIDLPRTSQVFDAYFRLDAASEFIDLDEEI